MLEKSKVFTWLIVIFCVIGLIALLAFNVSVMVEGDNIFDFFPWIFA